METTFPVRFGECVAPPPTDEESETYRVQDRKTTPKLRRDACLVYIYPTGPQMGARFPLGEGISVIGRTADCRVRNTDPSVSRLHARIEVRMNGQFYVTDLGSTNGTFVNGVRVTEKALADGDYLRVGNCIYRYLAGGNVEAEYHEEIYRLTVIDPLTGVPNRRYLLEYLDREMARATRHNRPLALALLDIDRFKLINDRLGHLAGDVALRELSARLKPVVRREELLARYGGEEFMIALPETGPDQAGQFGERIRRLIADTPFLLEGTPYPVTVSIGVGVMAGDEAISINDLIARADTRLFKAKEAGRNRVVV